jgi:hypothetical protein
MLKKTSKLTRTYLSSDVFVDRDITWEELNRAMSQLGSGRSDPEKSSIALKDSKGKVQIFKPGSMKNFMKFLHAAWCEMPSKKETKERETKIRIGTVYAYKGSRQLEGKPYDDENWTIEIHTRVPKF